MTNDPQCRYPDKISSGFHSADGLRVTEIDIEQNWNLRMAGFFPDDFPVHFFVRLIFAAPGRFAHNDAMDHVKINIGQQTDRIVPADGFL